MSPAEARDQGLPFRVLRPNEIAALDAMGEILHPGARDAGVSHFIDQQLSLPIRESLLIAKHFIAPPYLDFYRDALRALDEFSRNKYGGNFASLETAIAVEIIKLIRDEQPANWTGPPASLLYLIVRGDAVDVVYAGMDDYDKLGIPYMAHILPPSAW